MGASTENSNIVFEMDVRLARLFLNPGDIDGDGGDLSAAAVELGVARGVRNHHRARAGAFTVAHARLITNHRYAMPACPRAR